MLSKLKQKWQGASKLQKGLAIGVGALGASALAYGGYKLGKRFLGGRAKSRNTTQKLRGQVTRLALQVEKSKLQRKLRRELTKV